MEEKSTMPKKMETIYPTTKPIKTYRFFMKPLKNEWKRRHESSVIPPTRRFCQDPIGYALDEASVEIPVESFGFVFQSHASPFISCMHSTLSVIVFLWLTVNLSQDTP